MKVEPIIVKKKKKKTWLIEQYILILRVAYCLYFILQTAHHFLQVAYILKSSSIILLWEVIFGLYVNRCQYIFPVIKLVTLFIGTEDSKSSLSRPFPWKRDQILNHWGHGPKSVSKTKINLKEKRALVERSHSFIYISLAHF